MKKTIDFNKLAKVHKAKKAWEKLQKEKTLDASDLGSNQEASGQNTKSQSVIRKSS